jgi:hypothetical protein
MNDFFKKGIWLEFKGQKNTDDVIKLKSYKLSYYLVYLSAKATEKLFENAEIKLEESRYHEIFVEVSIFYLHFVDRVAFQYLEKKTKEFFMDNLFIELSKRILDSFKESPQSQLIFNSLFINMSNERQIEYGKYKNILPEKDENMRDSLFWEFGKKICSILKKEEDLHLMMLIQIYLTKPLIEVLNVPDLLKE